jgi:NitT/TauT family transport system permease protein
MSEVRTEDDTMVSSPSTAEVPQASAALAPTVTRRRRRRPSEWAGSILPPLGVFAAFIALWYAYAHFALDEARRRVALPYPHRVFTDAFWDADVRQELLSATWVSFRVAFTGLVIAMILGIAFAVLMSQARWIERSFYPYAVLVQTVPILALVPLIGLQLGYGFNARVLVVVIISLFPIITNTLFGLKAAERGHHELFSLHGASRLTRLRKLQLPASLPAMFTGFQISAGLAVIGSIVGGFFFGRGERDLGMRIALYTARLRPSALIGAIILSALLGVVFFQSFGWLGRRLTRHWYQPAGNRS